VFSPSYQEEFKVSVIRTEPNIVDELRIPKKFLNMKVKGKHPGRRPVSRWEQQVRKDIT
jgi:hypothetical protein